ncbi:hypothetical protein [Peribacillus kribbensis]|uniref:hypothetical protein n=1 Tax=Peribacillus kribbensis TaxID=356658 RepID=UPI00040420DC|nr:hypothetical protein [Peribacillus kribbensis]
MKDNKEYSLFLKELNRLFNDYKKCKDKHIRNEILQDIQLIGEAIDYPIQSRDHR